MNYAVIQTGGKQYKVTPGMELLVESLGKSEGSMEFDKVLLLVDDGKITLGTPYVDGVKIAATILSAAKGPKIHVSKFLAKSRYRRQMGHRQSLTKVQIGEFGTVKKSASVKTEVKESTIPVSEAKVSAPKKASVKKISKKA